MADAFAALDVAGYNYMWSRYESDHAAHPERIIYGSESFPKEIAQNWNLVEKHPYVIGDFVWTAIDYLGEAGLGHALELAPGERDPQFMDWPWYNAWCGDLDFCGDKKPQSYYRDVVWRQRDIAMAVHAPTTEGKKEVVNGWGWPNERLSWTWPGQEGRMAEIEVYSEGNAVELFQDGKPLGRKSLERCTAKFETVYRTGELRAVSYDETGNKLTEETLKTAGEETVLTVRPEKSCLQADGDDMTFVSAELTDRDGVVKMFSDRKVTVHVSGAGTLAAVGSGRPVTEEAFTGNSYTTWNGRMGFWVRSKEETGIIDVTVEADGLEPVKVRMPVEYSK